MFISTRNYLVSAILTLVVVISGQGARAAMLGRDSYGMNLERDQFLNQIYTNPSTLAGWLSDIGVQQVRTSIPPINPSSNQTWWNLAWGNTANFADTYDVDITFLINSGWWKPGADKVGYLSDLQSKVSQYAGKIKYYELGNEMDIPFRDQGVTVTQYKEWLTDVSTVIRAADPNAKLILTSMAGAVHNGQAFGYLEDVLAAGCGDLVDYYSIHSYPHSPDSDPDDDSLQAFMSRVSQMVDDAGAEHKPMFLTETGYALQGSFAEPGANEVTQQRWNTQTPIRHRIKDVADIYPLERIDAFVLKDYTVGDGGNQFGLLKTDNTQRLQYQGYKTAMSMLDGAVFFREGQVAGGQVFEFLKDNGQKVTVAWSTSATPGTATVLTGSTLAQFVDIQGNTIGFVGSHEAEISYTQDQTYLITDNATYWAEGEAPTSANFSPEVASDPGVYDASHLSIDTTTSGARQMSYNFDIQNLGTYQLYIAATSPTGDQTSPYSFAFHSGSVYDGRPLTDAASVAEVTGTPYGTDDALAWTYLGDFTFLQTGQVVLTLQVDQTRALDNRYVFGLDAVYLVLADTGIPGDVDGDGFVGLSDLDIILTNWNQFTPPADPRADVSSPGNHGPDGYVGLDDLDAVLEHWNIGTPPAALGIPEPAGILLIATWAWIPLTRSRR